MFVCAHVILFVLRRPYHLGDALLEYYYVEARRSRHAAYRSSSRVEAAILKKYQKSIT
jgi:hypothetical protein